MANRPRHTCEGVTVDQPIYWGVLAIMATVEPQHDSPLGVHCGSGAPARSHQGSWSSPRSQ